MELNGKIVELLPEKSGQSAKGTWRKQEYILETEGQYPKKICFMVWGDKIDDFALKQGDQVAVSIDIESREYNGRWYTDIKAWQVKRGEQQDNYQSAPASNSGPVDFSTDQSYNSSPLDDEIPF
ncbi:conserved hypothetical protein [Candidatus Terasakiella magnetica]|uniref:DUF3127 domain-containing protein n=1 Tax=Candidatus Terasakiella magnetica TaxID=1867952 RepID=A0A1C3REX8_9PROT|nr:DUF3127 domain-containing protein [Candidatus Terasakiella magnetica]SCA55764.1 conserved hypothetical protein [Candidatus Terasakiella magnetica]